MSKKVVVIGGGFAGLSASAYLAKNGFDVTLLEKNDQLGGRATVFRSKGFKFDMGPSWYMLPEIFDNFFTDLGKNRKDYYNIKKLDPSYKVFFSDGTSMEATTDKDKMMNYFESIEKGAGYRFIKHLKVAEERYNLAMENFIYKNFKNLFQMITPKLLLNVFKLGIFETWQSHINRYFKSKKLQQLVSWHAVFVGGEPKNIPSVYSLMAHADFNLGTWYPDEGFQSVIKAMTKVCEELGVEIKLNQEVKNFKFDSNKIVSVITDTDEFETDIVVSGADYNFIETKVLPDKFQTYKNNYWEKAKLGPSTFVIYIGINKEFTNMEHQNYYFSDGWDEHFDNLFSNKKWPNDPSIYISIPSKSDPNVAPQGTSNVFILIPAAPGLDDNDEIRERYFNSSIKLLEDLSGVKVEMEDIISKTIFAQSDHKNMYNAYKGNALGLAHTFFQTGAFRPRMKSSKIKNLYYAGQYTQPGTSTVMSIISGKLVSQEVKNDT